MKVRTSIKVDKDLLEATEQNARDLEIINEHADDLNKEALDVLDYQVAS